MKYSKEYLSQKGVFLVLVIHQPQQFTDNLLFLLFSLGNGITYRKEGAGVQEIVVYEFTHNGTNA